MAVYAITVSSNYTDGPTSTIYYKTDTSRYYSDESCTASIRSVSPFSRETFRFDGFWSTSSGGTQYTDETGKFENALLERVWAETGTIYAHWTRLSYKVTINANGGSGGVSALYKCIADGDVYTDDLCSGNPATTVELPSLAGSTCRGIGASTWAENTAIVDRDGNITEYFRSLSVTADTSRTAAWLADYVVTLNGKGGYGGTETVNYDRVRSAFKFTKIQAPEREGFHFLGYYTAASGGTQRIDASGEIVAGWAPTAEVTLYAQWSRFLFKITVSKGSGTGGAAAFYYNQDDDKFYEDADYTKALTTLELPYYKFFTCLGCYATNATTGDLYVDADGHLTNALKTAARSFTDNVTIYAQYSRLSWTLTISGSGTFPSGKTLYGKVTGGIYADVDCRVPLTAMTLPYYELNRFTGCRSANNDTSTLYVNTDGTFTSDLTTRLWSANLTIYARWTVVALKITISPNSGTFTPRAALYYLKNVGGVYNYWTCEGATATSIPMPVRPGYGFLGVRDANNDTSTLHIDANGQLQASLTGITLSAAKTIYARWTACVKVTLNFDGTVVYRDNTNGRWTDSNGAVISAITVPTRGGYRFLGYFTAELGGVKCIDEDGTFVAGYAPTAAATLYAKWGDYSYAITINTQGGTFEYPVVYYRVGEGGLYTDPTCQTALTSMAAPTRVGYDFAGVWSAASGGTLYINADGTFTPSFLALEPQGPTTVYSRWVGHTHTLTFDYNGGGGSVSSKSVTFGSAVGSLPAATKSGNTFIGWYVQGSPITSASIWNVDDDTTAVAKWLNEIGDVTDYFGLGSARLIPVSSSNGDNKKRICVAHTGRYERGVDAVSGIWRNPTVSYRVVGDLTLSVVLGRAWAGSGSAISGFMLTSLEVSTQIGEFPLVTLSAVANEGANAINLFNVSVAIKAAAHAQNLMSSISGGGELQALTLRASCDPVVIAENMMPCASDVVNGRIDVQAQTIAPHGEAAPSTTNSFVSLGAPKGEQEGTLTVWQIHAQKEIN